MSNTAADVLRIAAGELGYSRYNDPQQGTKYGRWYAQNVAHDSYYGTNGVPFCAMFVSWVFNQAGAKALGVPGAYCPSMVNASRSAALSNVRDTKPGDIVYFDWDGGVVDHVGLIEKNMGSYVQTIEGNTNNGQVARRTRSWDYIRTIVRPSYDGTVKKTVTKATTSSTTKKSAPSQAVSGKVATVQLWLNSNYSTGLEVDNVFGPLTKRGLTKALQSELNKQRGAGLDVDGVFGPLTRNACISITKGARGNITKTLQGALICYGRNTGGFDGIFGDYTYGAVQNWQYTHGLVMDGWAGPVTFASLLS